MTRMLEGERAYMFTTEKTEPEYKKYYYSKYGTRNQYPLTRLKERYNICHIQ